MELEDIRHYYPGIDPWKCSYLKCVKLLKNARTRDDPQQMDAAEQLRDMEDRLWMGGLT